MKSRWESNMRIAIIDHSYHQATKSNAFFHDILTGIGTVTEFFDETWCAGKNDWRLDFDETRYDLIVIWQAHEAIEVLSGKHNNVVFVPMYDGMLPGGIFSWKSVFKNMKCLSFCRKLHFEISRRGGTSRYFRFFPDPKKYKIVSEFTELRPFFWYRTNNITADLVLDMCRTIKINKFTIHNAPDPGQKALSITNFPNSIANYEITRWSASRYNYIETMVNHNVYFAPRSVEGIGMAFLEAMASGLCVVAANMPTMSEYISNGTNGILYSLERRFPLDLSRAEEIGARARESIERGFSDWQREMAHLVDYLIIPKNRLTATTTGGVRCSPVPVSGPAPGGKISVVTICLNAVVGLEKTINSVLGQDRPNVEYLILDGGSTDGSVEIINKFAPRLAYWHSAPNEGVYHAMNDSIMRSTGEWILFIKAGDTFSAADSLSRMFRHVPAEVDVVYGHHLFVCADGFEDYLPAADFETTWARLQRGEIWFDWLAGIPAHQATAVRRDLLAKLRFDTAYRLAADLDLFFRARKNGAKFFNCAELVCVCESTRMSSTDHALRRTELTQIVRNHGNSAASDHFYYKMLGAAEVAIDGKDEMCKRSAHAKRDHRWLEKAEMPEGQPYLSNEYIARRLAGHYDATLEEGIDFKRYGMPIFISDCAGVSFCEGWGRWTDGEMARFRFDRPLPTRFELELTGYVLGPNVGRDIILRVGNFKTAFRMTWPPAATFTIHVMNSDGSDAILLEIPNPTSPTMNGETFDKRRLGIALSSLKIKQPATNSWQKWKTWIGSLNRGSTKQSRLEAST